VKSGVGTKDRRKARAWTVRVDHMRACLSPYGIKHICNTILSTSTPSHQRS
jgi:hypothetical protein